MRLRDVEGVYIILLALGEMELLLVLKDPKGLAS